MADIDLDAIRDRAAWSYDWLCKDARERTGSEWLPLSVRDTFDYGVPALVAEVRRLTAALAEANAEDTTGGEWLYGRRVTTADESWDQWPLNLNWTEAYAPIAGPTPDGATVTVLRRRRTFGPVEAVTATEGQHG